MLGLFTGVVKSSDCTASRGEMSSKYTENYEEVVVVGLKYPEKIAESHQMLSKRGRYAGRHISTEVPTVTSV